MVMLWSNHQWFSSFSKTLLALSLDLFQNQEIYLKRECCGGIQKNQSYPLNTNILDSIYSSPGWGVNMTLIFFRLMVTPKAVCDQEKRSILAYMSFWCEQQDRHHQYRGNPEQGSGKSFALKCVESKTLQVILTLI